MRKPLSFHDTSVDFSRFEAAIFDLDGTLVHSEHVRERGKPDLLPYKETLRSLDIPAQHACAFEDSTSGIRSALSAGLTMFDVAEPQMVPQELG